MTRGIQFLHMPDPFLRRLVFFSLTAVLVFAAVFTVGEMYGVWPEAPAAIFRNADLVAGFLFVAAMALAALRALRRRREGASAPPPPSDPT